MIYIKDYGVQNYVITPAALAVNQSAPRNINEQKWLLTISGVTILDFKCTKHDDWSGETLSMIPDVITPMRYAISHFSIPVPADSPYVINGDPTGTIMPVLQVEEYAFSAALGSIYDQNNSVNAGFSVNSWKPVPFGNISATGPGNHPPLTRVYNGFLIEVATRDIDAHLLRVNFMATLLGKISFVRLQLM